MNIASDSFRQRGLLIVISGPSGSGKTSVTEELRALEPNIEFSISATTRAPRAGEVHGIDYYFINKEEFQRKIDAGEFAEWAMYGNHYYGTLKEFVEQTLRHGKDIILRIEVQGAAQLREVYPDGIFIFILPPSQASLENRLRLRQTESEADIQRRLAIAKSEIECVKNYDYIVFNCDNQLTQTVCTVRSIIVAARCRVNKQTIKYIQQEFQKKFGRVVIK